MNEWQECVLGDYAKVMGGYAFKSADFREFGDYPVIKIKNIASGTLDMVGCQYISAKVAAQAARLKAENGDILIAMTGSHITQPSSMVGRVTRFTSDVEAYINQRVGKIVSRDEATLNPDFLYYFMVQEDTAYSLANIASGSANQANISAGQIEALPLLVPCVDEQRAIAEVLSSLDDKIDLLTRQNATLEALAQTYFRQWFVEGASEDWEEVTIDKLVTIKGGTTPSTKVPAYWDGKIYWTTPRDLSNHNAVYLLNTERKITERGLAQIGSGLLPIGSVLLSSRAPIGYLAITDIPVAINQGYIGIVCNKSISNFFIYLWCQTNMELIENSGNGSVFQEIAKSMFKSLVVAIPTKKISDEFDKLVEPLFKKIRNNQHQIYTLQKLRDVLLPKLISGEIRVKGE